MGTAEVDEPCLQFRVVRVGDRDGERITEHRCCFLERHAVLPEVRRSLLCVPFEVQSHGVILHWRTTTRDGAAYYGPRAFYNTGILLCFASACTS